MQNNFARTNVRDPFLDFTKAIAIILVVFGHCIQYGSGTTYLDGSFFDDIVFIYIYSFHMPLFILISGYLFFFSINRTNKEILCNKFKCLIVPIFAWGIIHLIQNVIEKCQSGDFSLMLVIKDYIYYCVTSLWFLWAVFWCSLIVLIVNRIFKDRILIYFIGFVISFFFPDNCNLHVYKFVFPFFVLGYMYGKYDLKDKLRGVYCQKWFLCIIGAVFLFLLFFWERDAYIYVSKHSILGKNALDQITINLYRYLIGAIGSVFSLTFLYMIYSRITSAKRVIGMNLMMSIGKNTMGIYIISEFINILILLKLTHFIDAPNYLITAFESFLVISFSMLIIKLIRKNHMTNKFLLGAK